ncbi:MAG: NADH-flavin reductase [Dyadobacter sp. 50-39]|uniref:NAD(P)-dependent oxidoreductase n=1 Tax=Dyadobacter sp. 50-39 TaxID=1895756 RepID=UPI000959ACF6|nr:NAD(P)H-binding protein [Dyadobacter sp. 50-39]OJV17526.1 MAG: NADH-flavin reductase [Dyadobacter sp. 50-39]
MERIQKIAVIGGGGRTGQYLVNQLIEKGYSLKLLLRHPENFTIHNPLIEIVHGDVLNPQAVRSLVEDCDAVLSTAGQRQDEPLVASQATLNILGAIGERPVRYVVLAGLNVETPDDRKGEETAKATEWMRATFPAIHNDRQKSYSILAESNAEWTMVRVPYIEFNGNRAEVKVNAFDSPGAKIDAADIAGFMIDQLTDDTWLRKAPFISN